VRSAEEILPPDFGAEVSMQSEQCWQLSTSLTEKPYNATMSAQLFGNEIEETTFVIKGVPKYLTQWQLLDSLECLDPHQEGIFNLFHCPWNHEEGCNRGPALINFTSKDHAVAFQRKWGGVKLLDSAESLTLRLSAVQGFRANMNFYRKTEVNNSARDRPIYRDGLGCLLPFCWETRITLPGSLRQPEEEPEAKFQGFLSFDELALLAMIGQNMSDHDMEDTVMPTTV